MPNICPECRHILPGGRKCPQPALSGKPFCIHHCRSRNLVQANRARNHSIALPPLEDRAAIQMSLDVVLAALAAGKINRRTAATYAYAIKIGSDNLARMEQAPPPVPVAICRDEHGDILAAEPTAISIPATEPGCPIHATAPPSHGWETTTPQSTPVILSDRSVADEVEGQPAVTEPAVAATEPGCPIHATASPSNGWETTTPQSTPVINTDQSTAQAVEGIPPVAGPSIAATEPGCPIHATAPPSHGWETTTPQSIPVILSGQSTAQEPRSLPAVTEPAVAATEPGCPIHTTASPSNGWETTTPEPSNASLEDLRDTSASHEYDPEPPIPLTMTELRKSRLQIEQHLKQQREALRHWSTSPDAKREGEDPQLVINYIQKNIHKLEAELKEITRLETPDPQEPDSPF